MHRRSVHWTCRRVAALAAGTLCLASSGCFSGTVGAVVGIVESSDGSSGGRSNAPPDVDIDRQGIRRLPGGGEVGVEFTVSDDRDDTADLEIEWQTDAEFVAGVDNWLSACSQITFDDETLQDLEPTATACARIRLNAPGEAQRVGFVWDARASLQQSSPPLEVGRVHLRIRASDGGREGRDVSEAFIAGNELPVAGDLRLAPDFVLEHSGAVAGVVPLLATLSDSTCDPVLLRARFFLPGRAAPCDEPDADGGCAMSIFLAPETTFDTCRDGGSPNVVTLSWNTAADLGETSVEDVLIEIAPEDLELGTPATLELAGVDNNANPDVRLLDLGGSPDRGFVVPLRFLARDAESHPVTVIFQWTPLDESFEPLDLAGGPKPTELSLDTPSVQELALIETLARVAGAVEPESTRELRRRLRIATLASVSLEGETDESADLAPLELRETDFVRHGLVFVPPNPDGPRPVPSGPVGVESGLYLCGLPIELFPGGAEGPLPCVVTGFDASRAVATLGECDGAVPTPIAAGTPWRLRVTRDLVDLPAPPEGTIHTALWRVQSDVDPEIASSTLRVRAIAFDSVGQGSISGAIQIDLDSGVLVPQRSVAGSPPRALAMGDVNGDGRRDLVVLNQGTTADLYIRPTFTGELPARPTATQPTGFLRTNSISLGDLNGDRRVDLLITNEQSRRGAAFLQSADGTFPALPDWNISPVAGNSAHGGLLGDLNRDGAADLAILNNEGSRASTIGIYFQNAPQGMIGETRNGFVEPNVLLATQGGRTPLGAAIADLSGDGHNDLVVLDSDSRMFFFLQDAPGFLGVQLGGPGSLRTENFIVAVDDARKEFVDLAVADIDGDGLTDIVTLDRGPQQRRALVFLQKDAAVCGLPFCEAPDVGIPIGPDAAELRLDDADADGRTDLYVLEPASSRLCVSLQRAPQQGTPIFAATPDVILRTERDPVALALADLDGDERTDVIIGYGEDRRTVEYVNRPEGSLPTTATRTLTADIFTPSAACIGDVDGDGRGDLVVVNEEPTAPVVNVYLQNAAGALPATPNLRLFAATTRRGASAVDAALADIDGDGRNDVAVALAGAEPSVGLFLSRDERSFVTDRRALVASPVAMEARDIDADGRNDVIALLRSTGDGTTGPQALIFLHEPDGSLAVEGVPVEVGAAPLDLVLADLGRDGMLDLVVLTDARDVVELYAQRPRAAGAAPEFLRSTRELATGRTPSAVFVADLDDDGTPEVVALNQDTPPLASVFRLAPDGEPSGDPPLTVRAGENSFGIAGGDVALADVDGDGRRDLIVVNRREARIHIYSQGRTGTLPARPSRSIETAQGPDRLAIGDLNGDRCEDLVVVHPDASLVTILIAR